MNIITNISWNAKRSVGRSKDCPSNIHKIYEKRVVHLPLEGWITGTFLWLGTKDAIGQQNTFHWFCETSVFQTTSQKLLQRNATKREHFRFELSTKHFGRTCNFLIQRRFFVSFYGLCNGFEALKFLSASFRSENICEKSTHNTNYANKVGWCRHGNDYVVLSIISLLLRKLSSQSGVTGP